MSKTPAPLHTYHVAYRRVAKGMIFNTVIRDTTVQEVVKTLIELEPDHSEVEILFIVKE